MAEWSDDFYGSRTEVVEAKKKRKERKERGLAVTILAIRKIRGRIKKMKFKKKPVEEVVKEIVQAKVMEEIDEWEEEKEKEDPKKGKGVEKILTPSLVKVSMICEEREKKDVEERSVKAKEKRDKEEEVWKLREAKALAEKDVERKGRKTRGRAVPVKKGRQPARGIWLNSYETESGDETETDSDAKSESQIEREERLERRLRKRGRCLMKSGWVEEMRGKRERGAILGGPMPQSKLRMR